MNYSDSFTPEMMEMIAREQAEIFELAEEKGYDMNDFSYKYMNCDFCNREMDSQCSFFHFKPCEVCMAYIEKECRFIPAKEESFYNAGWVGFIYRHLVFTTGISSREIVEKIPPKELDDLYFSYELYETEDTVRKIIEEYELIASE